MSVDQGLTCSHKITRKVGNQVKQEPSFGIMPGNIREFHEHILPAINISSPKRKDDVNSKESIQCQIYSLTNHEAEAPKSAAIVDRS